MQTCGQISTAHCQSADAHEPVFGVLATTHSGARAYDYDLLHHDVLEGVQLRNIALSPPLRIVPDPNKSLSPLPISISPVYLVGSHPLIREFSSIYGWTIFLAQRKSSSLRAVPCEHCKVLNRGEYTIAASLRQSSRGRLCGRRFFAYVYRVTATLSLDFSGCCFFPDILDNLCPFRSPFLLLLVIQHGGESADLQRSAG
jgi:hypothetical protein